RDFLAVHFKFNTRYDTPYWQACQAKAELCGAQPIVEYFQENGPSVLWRTTLFDPKDQFGVEGYLSLLVGQQVPYRADPLTAEEQANWERIRKSIRAASERAISVPQALALIRSTAFQWPEKLYIEGIGARPLG